MKPKEKILTYDQAKELKWFCKNCTGLRQEYYEIFDQMLEFKKKLNRLQKTSDTVFNYLKENGIDANQEMTEEERLRKWTIKQESAI